VILKPDLPSFHHPPDERPRGEADCKSRRNHQYRVTLDTLSCVIQEFFGSIAATLCGTLHYVYAILDCIGDRAACTRRLVSRSGNVFGGSFDYGL
jgi:hypothetical protein